MKRFAWNFLIPIDNNGKPADVNFLNFNIEYDANNNPIYIGYSGGVDPLLNTRSIQKIFYDANNNPIVWRWADGVCLFNKVRNDRATYTY